MSGIAAPMCVLAAKSGRVGVDALAGNLVARRGQAVPLASISETRFEFELAGGRVDSALLCKAARRHGQGRIRQILFQQRQT